MRRKQQVIIVRRPSAKRQKVALTLSDFEDNLSHSDIQSINNYCNNHFKREAEGGRTLQECVLAELKLAKSHNVDSLDGLLDWLALASGYGWHFIKSDEFTDLDNYLKEPSGRSNAQKLAYFLEQID